MVKKFVKKHKRAMIITSIILIALSGGLFFLAKSKADSAAQKYAEAIVSIRDIAVTISGSGTVASSYRQEVSPKVGGTITKVNFKEGDKVKAGDLMIQIDDQDIVKEIERTKLSIKQAESGLEEARKDINNLSVTSPINGQLINFSVKEGDKINNGTEICTINDSSKLIFTVPFNYNQAKKIYIGQNAEVYLQDYMQVIQGKVTYVDKTGRIVEGGGKVYDVEILLSNPGTISTGITASARINGEMCMDSSTLEYRSIRKVKAEVGGIVKSVSVKNNQQVKAGQVLFRMEDSSLYNQLLAAQIKLEDLKVQLDSQLEQQENYKVFAPVSGTIVSQNIKVGDNVEAKTDKLCVVADYDQMEFEIDVDELDIAKISVGMQATVTIDALENQIFEGEVTKVANEGTSENGVATYPVIVKIKSPKNIKGGMNANAEIVIQKKENVLAIPTTAVQSMGRRSFVYAEKSAGDNSAQEIGVSQQNRNSGARADSTSSGTSSQRGVTATPRNTSQTEKLKSNMTRKIVETGLSDDDYIEITSGLSEGDKIYIPVTTSSSNSRNTMIRMGGGLMDGGGPPAGFNRSGNSNRSRTGGGTSENR